MLEVADEVVVDVQVAAVHVSHVRQAVHVLQDRPVRGVQARMAAKMTLSHKEIPAAKVAVEVDCTELVRLSDRFSSAEATMTPFVLVLRLLVIALRHNEMLNSTWVDSPQGPQVRVEHRVHLGIAAATERGLLVPVIADADS